MRASNAMVTTAASRRVYSPTISPGSTMQPVSSQRLADRRLVDRLVDLEEAAGLGPQPAPGSMPRRSRTTSPSSVIGSVVTTSRGLT